MTGLTPDITAVSVVRHGVLRLTFADGLTGEVDVLDRVRGPDVRAGRHTGWVRGCHRGERERDDRLARRR